MPRPRNSIAELFSDLDWFTIILYLIMVAFGVVSIYAASYDFDDASIFAFTEFSGKQIRWIGLSLLLGLIILLIDSRMYETYAYPIYIVMLLVLLGTIFIATPIKGSRSWLSLGPMSIQPAEFAKFATALALAKLFSGYNFVLNAGNYVKALAIIFLPILLILMQNETGSALTFMALFFVLYREGMSGLFLFAAGLAVVIFVVSVKFTETMVIGIPSGTFAILIMVMLLMVGMLVVYSRRQTSGIENSLLAVARNVLLFFMGMGIVVWILASLVGLTWPWLYIMIGIIGVACVYVLFETMRLRHYKFLIPVTAAVASLIFLFSVGFCFDQLQPHQQQRIKVVLGIEEDLRGSGYNVNQSKIAIGSGGFAGKGFLEGTQTKLKYVPEQHTDFIFCTIGEEEGFIGTVAVVLLFLALILRIITIAERQPSTFGRVYAYCVASFLIFHFCINIGMVIGLCPVIGIPLPFFSYGGSSLWGFTILLFILLRIDASRKYIMS